MKTCITLIVLMLMTLGCAQSTSKHITEFSQNDVKDGILVDVRTPEEFKVGHLDEAVNIDWLDKEFAKWFEEFPRNKTIYLYCKKGGRSAKAAKLLDSLGFKNVVDLQGGYDAWSEVNR